MPVGPFLYEHWLLGGSFVKYRLFVNDSLAAVGPFRPLIDGMPVLQEYDVTDHLVTGCNVLAMVSRGERKGFSLVLEVEGMDGRMHEVRSSISWRQREANSFYRPVCWECPAIDNSAKGGPGPGEYQEHLDGLVYPQGWRNPGFADSSWSSASSYGPVEEEYEVCETPPYQTALISPRHVRKLGEGNYLVDFGRSVFGGIELAGPSGGGTIELRLAEEVLDTGHARYLLRTENCYQERWTFSEGSEPLSHFGTRTFRYAEIDGWTGEFEPDLIAAIAVNAPFDLDRSTFRCDNEGLEQVWNLCKNSVAFATADVYTDCLTRERLAYEADTYVTMLTQFATEGHSATAKRTLGYLVRHANWPCEWWQFFIPLFHEYLLHTGDYDFVAEHYDFLANKTSSHPLMSCGIIREFSRECIVDWPASNRDGFVFGPGNAVANAYAYWDLVLLEALASYLGRDFDASLYGEKAAELRDGFNRHLFDESTGLYVDSIGSEHSSLHANMYALRFGLVPEDRQSTSLELVKNKGMACSVFASQFLLETLFMYREDAAAVRLMSSTGEKSWLEMIRGGATVTTESWLSEPKHNMSWAHPWGSGPGNVIVRHLFGLRPTAPGWSDYIFDPQPGGLRRGQLTVTTPRGSISAGFNQEAGEYQFSLDAAFEGPASFDRSSVLVGAETA